MGNKRVPEIRFSGFGGEWEQRMLGNISTKIGSGKTPKGGDKTYKSEGIPLLRSQNIFNDKVNINDVVHITPEIDEEMANSRVQKGDILLNITGASIGRSAVYELNHKANVNQHVSIIRPFSKVNPYFIQLNISSGKGEKQIELNQAGGGREGLNFKQIAKMSFYFPSSEEQDRLGHFFIQLDNNITFHQQELTTLKQTKQGFLQKMFPKEGESVPEIRFPGFTGDWEQRKLGELAEFSKGRGYTKNDLIDNGHPIILYGRLYTKYETVIETVDTFVLKKKNSILSTGNEVIVPSSGETSEDISRASVVSKAGIILGGDLNVIRLHSELVSTFLALTISNGKQQKELSRRAQGKSVVHLNNSDLKKVNLFFPQRIEQEKIGEFFKQLDDIIALHQQELETLKETKKAFLQKMFV